MIYSRIKGQLRRVPIFLTYSLLWTSIFKRTVSESEGKPVESVDILSLIPSSVLDDSFKQSLREISKFAEKTFSKLEGKSDHPYLVNLALLRLYHMEKSRSLNSTENFTRTEIPEKFLSVALRIFGHASDAYTSQPQTVPVSDILYNDLEDSGTQIKIPRHAVFFDHLTESIIISIRGTASLSDVITDLYVEVAPFLDPEKKILAHRGMAETSKTIFSNIFNIVRDARSMNNGKYKSYRIIITGHSLGGGVATLLGLLMGENKIPCTVFAFAPPPTVSVENVELNEKCTIYNFVNNEDIIPRSSHWEFLNMISTLSIVDKLPWNPVQRTSAIIYGSLSEAEIKEMDNVLLVKRDHLSDGKEDAELLLPGITYWIKPVLKKESLSAGEKKVSKDDNSSKTRSQVETSLIENEKKNGDKMINSIYTMFESLKPTDKNINSTSETKIDDLPAEINTDDTVYEALIAKSGRSMFTGYWLSGDNMLSDHHLSSHLATLLQLKTAEYKER